MKRTQHFLLLSLVCFLFSIGIKAQTFSDSLEQRILNAQADGRVIDNLNNAFSKSPKGEFLLAPPNKDLKFGILIYNIDIFPDRAEFSAGMAFRDSRSNKLITFRADHVLFSNTYGLTGPAKLHMVSDVSIGLGQSATIYFHGGLQNTYAVFDCKGLKEFGVSGRVDFNSDFLLPVGADGSILPDQNLNATFRFIAKSWSDLVVQVSIQPFQIKGLTDFVFHIDQATMDLSESFNAGEMQFPQVYNSDEILRNNPAIWEGFYLQKGSVMFPAHFQSADNQRPELGVQNLLIDEFGFSGSIFGKHIISFEKGRLANWNFSIEQVQIDIVLNEITSGRMAGAIGMPILPDTTRLSYSAYINANDNYGLLVSMQSGLTIPAFKVAKASIAPNSYIDMEIVEGKVLLAAELNGELLIENKMTGAGPQFNFPSVVFQGFRVANTEPRIDIKYLGLKNTANTTRVNSYPVNFNAIYFKKSGNQQYIGVDVGLNLMEQIAVRTGLRIYAQELSGRFGFQRIELNEIDLKAVSSCFRLEGKLNFIKEDIVFGNGLGGTIKFNMEKPKIAAAASILFGSINGHRYWYFDASALWDKPGLPFFAGAEINGFIGGAWHGMREVTEKDNTAELKYGTMSNGRTYLPDSRSGLGLKAGVYMRSTGGTGNSKPFIASVILEMQFNANKGLNRISLQGTMDLMVDHSQPERASLKESVANVPGLNAWDNFKKNYQPKGKIGGPFMMDFDFINKIYQANFAIYLQGVANNKIAGNGPKGLAGEASAYFSSQKWYVWLGTPQQPLSVKLNLGKAGNAGLTAYFMAGDEVKPAMPLPREITSVLGEQQSDAMRNLNAMAEGNAFAFGARFNMMAGSSGGEGNVSIYANLKAIVGFDINLASYGKNTSCTGYSGPPGVNGWYANGQLFAFMQGKVGASYKAGALSGQVDLLTLTFASRLYCQGPNPFYSNGSSAVQVNIAGVINKKMNLNFEVGEPCELKRLAYTDTALILETYPSAGDMQVTAFLPLKTLFSVPIEKPFTDVDGRQVMFRVVKYEVTDAGKIINGRLVWNSEKNKLNFSSEKSLPGNKRIRVKMVVEAAVLNRRYELRNSEGLKTMLFSKDKDKFNATVDKMKLGNLRQMDFGNGKQVVCVEAYESILLNGTKVEESRDFYFTTASAPDKIPQSNIAYAWPVPDQLNYYKNTGAGFIRLQMPQDELLNVPGAKVMALYTNAKGVVIGESKVNVKGTNLDFVIPDQALSADGVYGLTIKRRDANASSELGKNVTVSGDFIRPENGVTSVSGTNIRTAGLADRVLLVYSFGVSKHNGFSAKMKALSSGLQKEVKEGQVNWRMLKEATEYFDKSEVYGLNGMKPLVGVKLMNEPGNGLTKECMKVYGILKCSDIKLRNNICLGRDTSEAGLYPYRAVRIRQDNADQMLLKSLSPSQDKVKPVSSKTDFLVECDAYSILQNDLEDIKIGLIQYVTSGQDINLQLVRNYCNLFQVKELDRTAKYESGQAYSDMKGMSANSLLHGNTGVVQADQKLKNGSGLNAQYSALLMQITKLKLSPLIITAEWPLYFDYTLPGVSKPISTYLMRTQ